MVTPTQKNGIQPQEEKDDQYDNDLTNIFLTEAEARWEETPKEKLSTYPKQKAITPEFEQVSLQFQKSKEI